MKKLIFTLCSVFFFSFVQAEDLILKFDADTYGDNFTNIDNGDTGPGTTIIKGVTFANVNAEFNKDLYNATKLYGNFGRVYLEAQSSSKKAGYIEFTAPNAGEVIVEAIIGSDPTSTSRNFSLEKKVEENWVNVKTFTITENANDTKQWLTYSADVDESSECTLRVINAQTGQTQITSITVKEYVDDDGDDKNYTSKEILNEQFNTTVWEGKTTSSNYVVAGVGGDYILTAASAEPINDLTASGASSIGRVSLTAKDSSIELPEVSSCGSITINANSGSVSKSIAIQKKVGDSWQTLSTFITPDQIPEGNVVPVKDYTCDVKSEDPITLRIINATSGAARIFEIWVTDYVEDPGIPQSIKETTAKGNIISTRYFSLTGMEMPAPAESGLYIQQMIYENGQVETIKVLK